MMDVGFDVVASSGAGAHFRLFAPRPAGDGGPDLVTFADDPGSSRAAVLLGRLFDRDVLAAGLPGGGPCQAVSDAALALAVYRHQGAAGLARLEGEFALAAWDGVDRRLVVARDPLGSWPLYWARGAAGLAVSTRLRALAGWRGDETPDPDFLAWFLMTTPGGVELPGEQTAYRGVGRVLPGAILALDASGRSETLRRWDWEDGVPDLAALTPREAGARFAELFRHAVRRRIGRGSIAAHLSGGMDSSSVVCVARDLIAEGAGRSPLATLSLVYRGLGLAGEREPIDLVLDQGGPIAPHLLEADDALDFRWFDDDLPAHDEPYAGLFRLALERRLVEGARDAGATAVLTGAGADDRLDGHRLHIADRLRQGRWMAALREARRWARADNRGLASVLYHHGLAPILPVATCDGLGPLVRGGYGRWPKPGIYSIPPWIRPGFARSHHLRAKGLQIARCGRGMPAERASDLWALQAAVGDWSSWYLAAPLGLHTSHPFLDPALLRFCLGLPCDVRQVPGVKKPVLQEAMCEVLPEPIRTRYVKRSFNAVYWTGLVRHLPHLEAMVRGSRIHELGLLDARLLIEAMRQHAVGIGTAMAGGRINSTLALIAWFDQWERSAQGRVASRPGPLRSAGPDSP
jgi:asparagine synthase (glutamine-hydrolysing)